MYNRTQFKSINWKDGMKITREHFVHLENVIYDSMRYALGLNLNSYNYGILPTPPDSMKSSLKYKLTIDNLNLHCVILDCHAVTPEGARVEIDSSGNFQSTLTLQPASNLNAPKQNTYLLVLSADPFNRRALNQIDNEEYPIRLSYAETRYELELMSAKEFAQNSYNGFRLAIAKIVYSEGSGYYEDPNYIQPCSLVKSLTRLNSLHTDLVKDLIVIENIITQALKKLNSKASRTSLEPLENTIFYFCQNLMSYTSGTLSDLIFYGPEQPPVYTINYFKSMARVISGTYRSLYNYDKEKMLNYFSKWGGHQPGAYESILNNIQNITYDHLDIHQSFSECSEFLKMYSILLNQLTDLHFIDEPDKNEDKAPQRITITGYTQNNG